MSKLLAHFLPNFRTDVLRAECVKILDARGWDTKDMVDLRKRQSMIDFLLFHERISALRTTLDGLNAISRITNLQR